MEFQGIPRNFNQFKWVNMSLCSLMMKVFKKDHCQLTYKPGSQDAITTKNEMIYNLLYLYVLRLKIRLDRHLFLRVRCLVVVRNWQFSFWILAILTRANCFDTDNWVYWCLCPNKSIIFAHHTVLQHIKLQKYWNNTKKRASQWK